MSPTHTQSLGPPKSTAACPPDNLGPVESLWCFLPLPFEKKWARKLAVEANSNFLIAPFFARPKKGAERNDVGIATHGAG